VRDGRVLAAATVLAQVAYPLVPQGSGRDTLTVLTVVLFALASLTHAYATRGPRTALTLRLVAGGGGLVAEAAGVATGFPFGTYAYTGTLGPELLDVPVVIPLAWTMMAWPAYLVGTRLGRTRAGTVAVGAAALASWDLFLDPQMVAEGYWTWRAATPALPGVPGIPIGNYLGWLGFAVVLMAGLAAAGGPRAAVVLPGDTPMLALWWWTYASSVLAHAVFLGLPASALWGGVLMGAIVLPLAVRPRRRPVGPA
jgi:putative membrane protein